jgi:hypothetical protein
MANAVDLRDTDIAELRASIIGKTEDRNTVLGTSAQAQANTPGARNIDGGMGEMERDVQAALTASKQAESALVEKEEEEAAEGGDIVDTGGEGGEGGQGLEARAGAQVSSPKGKVRQIGRARRTSVLKKSPTLEVRFTNCLVIFSPFFLSFFLSFFVSLFLSFCRSVFLSFLLSFPLN